MATAYPESRAFRIATPGALPARPAGAGAAAPGRAGPAFGRYVQALEQAVRRFHAPPDGAFFAALGWVVAEAPDSLLPVEALNQASAGGVGRWETAALARFLVVRSARSSRRGALYLERARGVLQGYRQLRPDDERVALWLACAHVLAGHLAEARREARQVQGGRFAEVAQELLAGVEWAIRQQQRSVAASAEPGWKFGSGWVRGRLCGGTSSYAGDGAHPDPMAATGARRLRLQAVRGQPVRLYGPAGRCTLAPVDGELLVGLVSLACRQQVRPACAGEPGEEGLWVARGRWACVLWPLPQPVGRLSGFFSQCIRRLREKVEQVAGGSVVEATHRMGYRLRAGVQWDVELDVASWAANWLLPRLPPSAPAEAGGEE
ncbi:MAG TPA: hypothetical protein VIL11_00010 [Limnochordales bacterium]